MNPLHKFQGTSETGDISLRVLSLCKFQTLKMVVTASALFRKVGSQEPALEAVATVAAAAVTAAMAALAMAAMVPMASCRLACHCMRLLRLQSRVDGRITKDSALVKAPVCGRSGHHLLRHRMVRVVSRLPVVSCPVPLLLGFMTKLAVAAMASVKAPWELAATAEGVILGRTEAIGPGTKLTSSNGLESRWGCRAFCPLV